MDRVQLRRTNRVFKVESNKNEFLQVSNSRNQTIETWILTWNPAFWSALMWKEKRKCSSRGFLSKWVITEADGGLPGSELSPDRRTACWAQPETGHPGSNLLCPGATADAHTGRGWLICRHTAADSVQNFLSEQTFKGSKHRLILSFKSTNLLQPDVKKSALTKSWIPSGWSCTCCTCCTSASNLTSFPVWISRLLIRSELSESHSVQNLLLSFKCWKNTVLELVCDAVQTQFRPDSGLCFELVSDLV